MHTANSHRAHDHANRDDHTHPHSQVRTDPDASSHPDVSANRDANSQTVTNGHTHHCPADRIAGQCCIIYLLLDTGIRASELCSLVIRDVDLKARHVVVMGKGDKERQIPFDSITGQVLWRYLAGRKADPVSAPLFPAWTAAERDCPDRRGPLDARDLYHVLQRIGQRAGVADVHPHRFRHTFAIQYLRNKGDVYTLQRILGHTTLDMVRRYLAIAQTDIEAAHRLASPVANWRL